MVTYLEIALIRKLPSPYAAQPNLLAWFICIKMSSLKQRNFKFIYFTYITV